MQKKKMTTLVTAVIALILAFQFLTGEEKVDQPVEPVGDVVVTQASDESEVPVADPSESPEDVPTETPVVEEDPFVELEEADGDFDYWVMALSWSPDYCASNDYNDAQQCSIGKQLDFVLHGLWPQYDNGYPSYCSTEHLPGYLVDEYAGLYPNDSLFDHEWEKHGTCTGLTPAGYLEWSERLKESLVIPPAFDSPLEPFRSDSKSLQAAFIEFNPAFHENFLAVYCSGSGRFLKEVFVCYEKDGEPTECGRDLLNKAAKSCGQPDFLVRNTR